MASKKTFKAPKKPKVDLARKTVSLTDEQYNELFNAVIYSSPSSINAKSPTTASSPGNEAKSPKESASVENSQSSQTEKQKLALQLAKNTESSTLSTVHSEEFMKNAVFSTPEVKKPKSYREAMLNLQNLKKNNKLPESLNSSISDVLDDCPYSQQPRGLTRRERLQWLQERRGTGLYVKCDYANCEKWRYLNVSDPVDVPHQWFCHLNPDKAYASCSVPEKLIPLHIEEDLIHNCYTAGSIVWAKMFGYPWWPAMVDDCPDCEQYYWINNELYDVPNWYHVVFFDEGDVSRRWMLVKDLKSFKHSPNLDMKYKNKQIYKKRLALAKTKANDALQLDIKGRLIKYSFLSLWKGEIPEYNDSDLEDSDLDENNPNFQRVIKKKIIQRRLALSQESASSVMSQKRGTKPKPKQMDVKSATSQDNASIPPTELSQESSFSEMNEKRATKTKKETKKTKRPKKIKEKSDISSKEINDTSISSTNRIQTRRMSASSENKTQTPTKSKEVNTENSLPHSCNRVQTRKMCLNSSRNSEDMMFKTIEIEKQKKTDKKSKAKKDNKKIISRRHTLSANENLNKSDANFKPEKAKLSRRKSEAAMKETGKKNAENVVDEEFIKEITARCNELKKGAKIELKKYNSSFKEDPNESLFSKDNAKIPFKEQTKKSSHNVKEKTVKKRDDTKRRKLDDKINAPPKTDTTSKKKKSFIPPVKKNLNSSTASSSSNFPESLFED